MRDKSLAQVACRHQHSAALGHTHCREGPAVLTRANTLHAQRAPTCCLAQALPPPPPRGVCCMQGRLHAGAEQAAAPFRPPGATGRGSAGGARLELGRERQQLALVVLDGGVLALRVRGQVGARAQPAQHLVQRGHVRHGQRAGARRKVLARRGARAGRAQRGQVARLQRAREHLLRGRGRAVLSDQGVAGGARGGRAAGEAVVREQRHRRRVGGGARGGRAGDQLGRGGGAGVAAGREAGPGGRVVVARGRGRGRGRGERGGQRAGGAQPAAELGAGRVGRGEDDAAHEADQQRGHAGGQQRRPVQHALEQRGLRARAVALRRQRRAGRAGQRRLGGRGGGGAAGRRRRVRQAGAAGEGRVAAGRRRGAGRARRARRAGGLAAESAGPRGRAVAGRVLCACGAARGFSARLSPGSPVQRSSVARTAPHTHTVLQQRAGACHRGPTTPKARTAPSLPHFLAALHCIAG